MDVNLDGTPSIDILSEIPDLVNANLEIRINAKDTPLFIQFWQEQYFGTFDSDIKQIILNPDQAPLPDSIHFPFPKMVTIEANDRIQVILAKQLFTRTGWKKVEITTLYKRFNEE